MKYANEDGDLRRDQPDIVDHLCVWYMVALHIYFCLQDRCSIGGEEHLDFCCECEAEWCKNLVLDHFVRNFASSLKGDSTNYGV